MNITIPGTVEEPGLDTGKVSTLEAPSGGAVNMHTIKGQVAVITGAAGGIGQALALDMMRREQPASRWSISVSGLCKWPAK